MFSTTKSFILKAFFIALFLSVPSSGNAADTGYLDRSERVNGWNTRSVFEPLYEKHRDSVVEILEDGHQIALGTVVSEDGYIVTKASEFGMALEVRDAKNKVYVPEFISVDRDNDLALLKISGGLTAAGQAKRLAAPSTRCRKAPQQASLAGHPRSSHSPRTSDKEATWTILALQQTSSKG